MYDFLLDVEDEYQILWFRVLQERSSSVCALYCRALCYRIPSSRQTAALRIMGVGVSGNEFCIVAVGN
jgi:hypothetical protein